MQIIFPSICAWSTFQQCVCIIIVFLFPSRRFSQTCWESHCVYLLQYAIKVAFISGSERCSLRNMPFNGSLSCNGTSEYFTCSVFCPPGMSFSFPPAHRYTCYYQTGVFSPSNVPQCQFGQRYVAAGWNPTSIKFVHILIFVCALLCLK